MRTNKNFSLLSSNTFFSKIKTGLYKSLPILPNTFGHLRFVLKYLKSIGLSLKKKKSDLEGPRFVVLLRHKFELFDWRPVREKTLSWWLDPTEYPKYTPQFNLVFLSFFCSGILQGVDYGCHIFQGSQGSPSWKSITYCKMQSFPSSASFSSGETDNNKM